MAVFFLPKSGKAAEGWKFTVSTMTQKPYQTQELAPDCFDPAALEAAYEQLLLEDEEVTIEEYIVEQEGNPSFFREPLKRELNDLGLELPADPELLNLAAQHREYLCDIENESVTLVEFIQSHK
jgi:hypothetical protein